MEVAGTVADADKWAELLVFQQVGKVKIKTGTTAPMVEVEVVEVAVIGAEQVVQLLAEMRVLILAQTDKI